MHASGPQERATAHLLLGVKAAHCVEDAVELLAEQAQTKRIDLNLSLDRAGSGYVMGDSGRKRQVLVNVIASAIKFAQSGGVAVCVSSIDNGQAGAVVTLEVRDTGIGMEPKMQASPFQTGRAAVRMPLN